jgi:hypothetical protein
MDGKIDTTGIDRAQLLAGLFNAALPGGGVARIVYDALPEAMTIKGAQGLLDEFEYPYFDYVRGRVIKCDVGKDHISHLLYDRDNGEGAAARVVEALRALQEGSA